MMIVMITINFKRPENFARIGKISKYTSSNETVDWMYRSEVVLFVLHGIRDSYDSTRLRVFICSGLLLTVYFLVYCCQKAANTRSRGKVQLREVDLFVDWQLLFICDLC